MSRAFTVTLTHPLGWELSTEVTSEGELDGVVREYGARGWSAIPMRAGGVIQPGGLQLPYDNEHDFDWSLLGGYKFADKETGEALVWCRGYIWKRRELEAVQSKKMNLPAAIKYSRGARPGDPDDIREADAGGEIEYVTLVMFRGGRRNDRYAVRSTR